MAAHVVLIGTLMASRIPTFAGKHVRIKHEYIPQFMLACSFLLVLFTIEPWMFLPSLSVIYLGSIPFSIYQHRKLKAADPASRA